MKEYELVDLMLENSIKLKKTTYFCSPLWISIGVTIAVAEMNSYRRSQLPELIVLGDLCCRIEQFLAIFVAGMNRTR